MKGLLIKDFYTVVGQLKIFIIAIAVLIFIPGYNMSTFGIIYAALLPISALAWDQQSKWDNLARMMPYSRLDLVFSKYLIGYIAIDGATVLCFIGAFAYSLFPGGNEFTTDTAVMFLLSAASGVFLLSLNLPLMFRLGVEKGRLIFGVMVGASCAAAVMAKGAVEENPEAMSFVSSPLFMVILAAAVIGISVGSVFLSAKRYGRNN